MQHGLAVKCMHAQPRAGNVHWLGGKGWSLQNRFRSHPLAPPARHPHQVGVGCEDWVARGHGAGLGGMMLAQPRQHRATHHAARVVLCAAAVGVVHIMPCTPFIVHTTKASTASRAVLLTHLVNYLAVTSFLQATNMLLWLVMGMGVAAVAMALVLSGRHPPVERMWAHDCYMMAEGALRDRGRPYYERDVVCRAADIYIDMHGWKGSRKVLLEFIRRYAVVDPDRPLRDKPRPGLEPRMTDEECEQCINELRAGYPVGGHRELFRSLNHAASMPDLCPTVAACRKRYSKEYEDGMWARLRKYDPGLRKYKQTPKHRLTPDEKQQRVACSKWLLAQGLAYLKRIFFIDAKTIYVSVQGGYVIGHKADRSAMYREVDAVYYYNCITHTKDLIRIEFYAMANYYGGVCGFRATQGTTGAKLKFKVRHYSWLLNTWGGSSFMHATTACPSACLQQARLCLASSRSTLRPCATATASNLASVASWCSSLRSDMHRFPLCVMPSTCTHSQHCRG